MTKTYYYQKPVYEDLESSLRAMLKECRSHDVTKVAMPRIGCGLDGLEWDEVSKIIENVFLGANMDVTVYELPQKACSARPQHSLKPTQIIDRKRFVKPSKSPASARAKVVS